MNEYYYDDIFNTDDSIKNTLLNLLEKNKFIYIKGLNNNDRYSIYKEMYYPLKFEKIFEKKGSSKTIRIYKRDNIFSTDRRKIDNEHKYKNLKNKILKEDKSINTNNNNNENIEFLVKKCINRVYLSIFINIALWVLYVYNFYYSRIDYNMIEYFNEDDYMNFITF